MSSADSHGIVVTESPTQMPQSAAATNGVPVIFGTAPVNMAANPANSLNNPILCTSYEECVEAFGYSDDFLSYTLCASIYAHFVKEAVGPVVFVNVLDPDTHTKVLAGADYTVKARQAKVEVEGVLAKELVVKDGETTLTAGTDYTVSFNTSGYLVVTLIAGTAHASAATLNISGNQLDPSLADEDTVIGGYDTQTKKRTGLEVLSDVYPKTGQVPGRILAPYWSKKKSVAKMIQLKAEGINDSFRATAIIDLDTTTCKDFESVKDAKDTMGVNDSDAIACWPMVVSKDHPGVIPYSAVFEASMQATDINHDSVPSKSPSNVPVTYVSGTVLEDGTTVEMDRAEANVVENAGVVTIYRWNGYYRTWGNYTAAYPEEKDAKDYWINVRRMFSWQSNNFVLLYFDDIDENISYRLIQSILDSENQRLSAYVPTHLAAARIEFRATDNPDADIVAGRIQFKQYLSPYVPAKIIANDLEYDVNAMIASLFGEEAA